MATTAGGKTAGGRAAPPAAAAVRRARAPATKATPALKVAKVGRAAKAGAAAAVVKTRAVVPRPAGVDKNELQRLKRLDLKRLELLRAAVRVFNARGATNTSLEDVAAELGLTKAALYYYFESKQEILYACYQMSLDLSDAVIAEAQRHGASGCAKLEYYIRRVIELGLSELQPTIGLRQQLALEPEYLKKLVKRRREHRDNLRRMIAEGVADGTVADCYPEVLQSIIAGAHSWVFLSYRNDGALSAAEVARAVVALLSGGFAARPRGKPGK